MHVGFVFDRTTERCKTPSAIQGEADKIYPSFKQDPMLGRPSLLPDAKIDFIQPFVSKMSGHW
jgi:hypothetical protein